MMLLPSAFKERIINTHGDKGQAWLDDLPNIIEYCQAEFNMTITNPLPHLSFNYTVNAIQENGQRLIVKFCVAGDDVCHEIDALQLMRGDGMVKLLKADRKNGILLLEKLQPGKTLSTLPNDELATQIAADIMQKIWKPLPDKHSFPTTHDWFDRLNQPVNLPSEFSASLLDKAKGIARELHQSINETVLLHGDLHHFNILSAQRQPWCAIDPKGILGEREYEAGAFLRNPIPNIATSMNTKDVLTRRIDRLSEILDFDRQKIIGWGFSQAVLATVWCLDAKAKDWYIFSRCAEVLAQFTQNKT